MDFEWDEAKRGKVLFERGIDFVSLAPALFDGRPVMTVQSPRADEERFVTIGAVEGRFFAVVWMWRNEAIRLISARRARDGEERYYHALFG